MDLQFTLTPENFNKIMVAWGESGRMLFSRWLWLDYLYPIAYASLFYRALVRIGRKYLAILAPMAAFFDYLENSLELWGVNSFPKPIPGWASWGATGAASLKWGIILLLTLSFAFRPKWLKIFCLWLK